MDFRVGLDSKPPVRLETAILVDDTLKTGRHVTASDTDGFSVRTGLLATLLQTDR